MDGRGDRPDGRPRGLAFPFRVDPRSGGLALAEGSEKLRQNLAHLLLTRVGERAMAREYGGGVTALLQEPLDEGLLTIAQHQISLAILRYEPRVLPGDVAMVQAADGELRLRVTYVEAGAAGLQSTVVPIS
jgi:phage baseplate assembly protein W